MIKHALSLLLIPACLLFGDYPEGLSSPQITAWEEMSKTVDAFRDGVGLDPDPGIKKTLIALNLLGYQTDQSCEGHLNRAECYPWVRFFPNQTLLHEISTLQDKRNTLLEEVDQIEEEYNAHFRDRSDIEGDQMLIDLSTKRKENSLLAEEIKQLFGKLYDPIWTLLEEFYAGEDEWTSSSLIVHEGYLLSVGGLCQKRYSKEKQEQNLIAFRKEMDRFTEFLIEKFRKSQ